MLRQVHFYMKGGKLQFAAVCTEVRIADLVAVGPKRGNGGYFSSMYFHIQDRCDRSDQFVSDEVVRQIRTAC